MKTVSIPLNRRYAMLTYHPSPVDGTAAEKAVETIFKAVDAENLDAVASYANADAGGSAINAALDRAAQSRPGRVHLSPSLGQIQYLSLMRGASVVIGNSSSGIIEAPALGVPVVNIGFRQRGRLRAPAVLDCSLEPDALRDALDHALSDDFRMRRCTGETPYGDGNTSSIVVATMRSTTLDRRFLMKRFHDGDETKG
ncbi:MAG: hypothetical protein CO113_08475 [Elusimicrobia bacterium CG_4_9_14_3_um_filter_62_55]|nr:MAG: hypothetical protein CO113_08475 [Elusimicrobia bacterium CG_4_9_14_3_um_filter_62_55]